MITHCTGIIDTFHLLSIHKIEIQLKTKQIWNPYRFIFNNRTCLYYSRFSKVKYRIYMYNAQT